MSAYVVVDIQVTDFKVYDEYKSLAPATVAQFGGRYLARGGRTEKLEGNWLPTSLVILEFPSLEQAKAWINSPEYNPIKILRHQSATSNMVLIEGV